jgi:hypothetical protein
MASHLAYADRGEAYNAGQAILAAMVSQQIEADPGTGK